MRDQFLPYLVCPTCQGDLSLQSVTQRHREQIEAAQLVCASCQVPFPIVRGIPRFGPSGNYAASFGIEWMAHACTQYDEHTGLALSETRFFEETRWPRDLSGQLVLEVGSGSGRFTVPAASTGATVISMDYSLAVEANYASNGARENVLIVQADLYAMPFRPGTFDRIFCFGVLQHTPDVHRAFLALPQMLKPGGELVVDVYKKTFARTYLATKYYVRWWTRRMNPEQLLHFTRRWIDVFWPLSYLIRRIPRIGPALNWRLLIPDYSREGLRGSALKEWAYLDIFDMLAPRYDSPQTIATLRQWFEEADMMDINVHYGYNGIEGSGKRKLPPAHGNSRSVAVASRL